MMVTQRLHDIGQSLWLDGFHRDQMDTDTLERYVEELSVTGVRWNPRVLMQALSRSNDYDASLVSGRGLGHHTEDLLYDVVLEDLERVAALLRPGFLRTEGCDGRVTVCTSPRLLQAPHHLAAQAEELCERAGLANLVVEIPGTRAGLRAAEEALCRGVPVLVTHLYSLTQYRAAVNALLQGLEHRRQTHGDLRLFCGTAVHVGMWDPAVASQVPAALRGMLGHTVARRIYQAYEELRASDRVARLQAAGLPCPTLAWVSTSSATPQAVDLLNVESLAAPATINILSEVALLAFARHGDLQALLTREAEDVTEQLEEFSAAGLDPEAMGDLLQHTQLLGEVEGWLALLTLVEERASALQLRHGDVVA